LYLHYTGGGGDMRRERERERGGDREREGKEREREPMPLPNPPVPDGILKSSIVATNELALRTTAQSCGRFVAAFRLEGGVS
jgi:hypothetical protein